MTREPVRPNYRKLLLQLISGALVGAVAGFAIATFVPQIDRFAGGGAIALAGVGLIYVAMGLLVGLAGSMLLATFIAAGRRGLLLPQ